MPFFRFHKMNFNSFKEVQKTRNLIALEVEKRKEIKEETFLEDLMKSFEHKQKSSKEGLEIPSKNVDLLRQQYAFFNWKIEDEAIKYQNRLVFSFVNEFGQYAKVFSDLQRKVIISCIDRVVIVQMLFQEISHIWNQLTCKTRPSNYSVLLIHIEYFYYVITDSDNEGEDSLLQLKCIDPSCSFFTE